MNTGTLFSYTGASPSGRCSNQESILTPPLESLHIPFGRFILNETRYCLVHHPRQPYTACGFNTEFSVLVRVALPLIR